MAEESKQEVKQPENPRVLNVPRNEASIEMKEARTTKGKNPGKTIFEPVISDIDSLIQWFGKENVGGILKKHLRKCSGEWVDEATDDETGAFKEPVFIQLATTFDATGETMEDLKDEKSELETELSGYNTDDPAQLAKFVACAKKLQTINVAIGKKSRARKSKPSETVAQPA